MPAGLDNGQAPPRGDGKADERQHWSINDEWGIPIWKCLDEAVAAVERESRQ